MSSRLLGALLKSMLLLLKVLTLLVIAFVSPGEVVGVIAMSLAEYDLASPSDISATGMTLLSGSSRRTCSSMVPVMSQVSMYEGVSSSLFNTRDTRNAPTQILDTSGLMDRRRSSNFQAYVN